jgi:hypothetical protein
MVTLRRRNYAGTRNVNTQYVNVISVNFHWHPLFSLVGTAIYRIVIEKTMTSNLNVETRANIKFCVNLGHTPTETLRLLEKSNSAHRASSTSLEIDLLDFETIVHPPYSPDLAPMDFSIFPEIKRQLRGLRFESAIDLSLKVRSIVASFPESWYVSVFDQWIRRHEKCVIREGDYVEKWTGAIFWRWHYSVIFDVVLRKSLMYLLFYVVICLLLM